MQYPFQENLYHKHTENVLEARVEAILNFDNEHICTSFTEGPKFLYSSSVC